VRLHVLVPGLLRAYTGGAERIDVEIPDPVGQAAPTLADGLAALDRAHPGLRFRIIDEQGAIRPHIRLFVDGIQARALDKALAPDSAMMIVGALSGG
jgi:molybdopterin synthase sulfur carrier subunit